MQPKSWRGLCAEFEAEEKLRRSFLDKLQDLESSGVFS
jgi:hypothetical protein